MAYSADGAMATANRSATIGPRTGRDPRKQARPSLLDHPKANRSEPGGRVAGETGTLEEAASDVTRGAERTLKRWTARLNLTAAQQDSIFPLLARSMPQWQPDFRPRIGESYGQWSGDRTGVEPAPSASGGQAALTRDQLLAEVEKYLTPAQLRSLLFHELQTRLWWQNALKKLRDASVPSTPANRKPVPRRNRRRSPS
ncbi:MAG: hypothetical protein AAF492_17200, partial [Verrucomicrobiota bacterium]